MNRLLARWMGIAALSLSANLAYAGAAPEPRVPEPVNEYRMVVTLCGYAVQLAVQPENGVVTHYVGDLLPTKLEELGITRENTPHYDLAEIYEALGAACGVIDAEQARILAPVPR